MSNPNILIISPSIHTKDNVSGIANLTRLLFENNREVNYTLFTAGKKDNLNLLFIGIYSKIPKCGVAFVPCH